MASGEDEIDVGIGRASHKRWRRLAARLTVAAATAWLGGLLGLPVSAGGTGDASAASCTEFAGTEASPGFRDYLPDCRAYELITPPYKEGAPLQALGAIGEDGSHVIAGSLGVFGGSSETSSDLIPNVSEIARSGSEWVATPLAPSPSAFAASNYLDASAGLDRTLWEVHTPADSVYVHDFYYRESDGTFVRIGTGIPPGDTIGPPGPEFVNVGISEPQYRGASADFTHLVYSIEPAHPADLWPGDTTVAGLVQLASLYEYVGTNNSEPMLVGVRNAGRLEGTPHVNEGAELISQCGTGLGGGTGGSAYGAISENGERIYFTSTGADRRPCGGAEPATNELYVREAGARTIAISSRSPSECTGACATSTAADANFEGASADGARGFFTSTQQLLNGASEDSTPTDSASVSCSATTGTGGCNLYEYDFNASAGHNLALASGGGVSGADVQGVVRVSRDGSHVYFVAKSKLTGANPEGLQPIEGQDNLYVYQRDTTFPTGHTTFVATLATTDAALWARTDLRSAETTPSGRYLVFSSHARLTADDESSEAATQLFEYDASEGRLVRVSIGHKAAGGYLCPASGKVEEGYGCDGNVATEEQSPTLTAEQPDFAGIDALNTEADRLSVSSDGSRVVFESAAGLSPQSGSDAVSGCTSAYEYASSGSIASGNVFLISDGDDVTTHEGRCGSQGVRIDASGTDVFFETGDSLVPQDTDTQGDIYDARIGGGFPGAQTPPRCGEESCLGPLAPAPVLPSSGTALDPAGGNLPPPAPTRALTAAQLRARQLAKALAACRKLPRARRHDCEVAARRRYRRARKAASNKRRAGGPRSANQ